MNSLDDKTQNKIIALISVLIPEAHIYLFGSRARGTNQEYADIDLALDAGKVLCRSDVDEVKSVLRETNIMYVIDVVDFHAISPLMREEILRDKIIWSSCAKAPADLQK